MRLVDGFGTPCDPLYTGVVEIFHAGEWGAICVEVGAARVPIDLLAADTVCRQLGFPHGTIVSTLNPRGVILSEYAYFYPNDADVSDLEESESSGRVWLHRLQCSGGEEQVLDCLRGPPQFFNDRDTCINFRDKYNDYYDYDDYTGETVRMEVACRQFAVEEAAETNFTSGAGAPPLFQHTGRPGRHCS